MAKKLKLSSDKKIGGVCAGFAEYFGMDVTLARIIYIALMVITGVFPLVIIYLVAWALMPKK